MDSLPCREIVPTPKRVSGLKAPGTLNPGWPSSLLYVQEPETSKGPMGNTEGYHIADRGQAMQALPISRYSSVTGGTEAPRHPQTGVGSMHEEERASGIHCCMINRPQAQRLETAGITSHHFRRSGTREGLR